MKKVTDNIREREDLEQRSVPGSSDLSRPVRKGEPLGNATPDGEPIEHYKFNSEADIIKAMQIAAVQCAENARRDGHNVFVSGVALNYPIGDEVRDSHFSIKNEDDEEESYTIYRIGSNVLYRPTDEYLMICDNIDKKIPGYSVNSLFFDFGNPDVKLDVFSVVDREDCMFIIFSIFSSMCGKSYEDSVDIQDNVNEIDINESCRIRKHNKLGTDGLVKNSKKYQEAKYGTPEENAFKQEIEDKQKQDGTVGALDQQPQENAFKQILPNVHMITESKEVSKFDYDKLRKLGYEDIEYEPGDRVVVGKDKLPGRVTTVWDTVDAGQMITVLLNNGSMAYVTFDDIEPDVNAIDAGRTYCLGMPYTTYDIDRIFNLDMRDRMPDHVMNDDEKTEQYIKSLPKDAQKEARQKESEKHRDMNERNILCNIVLHTENGTQKLSYDYCYASMKDIIEGKNQIGVVNESGELTSWPIENIEVEPQNWPFAVVVDGAESDEPLRKIHVDPVGYVEATDDEFVDCIVGGKLTKMYKKNIKIIS